MNLSQAIWSRDLCIDSNAASLICEINLGATAIGTRITAHPDHAELVREKLGEVAGIPVVIAIDLIEATQDLRLLRTALWVLKRGGVKLSKMCNDLRLLSSGPRAVLMANLPARQELGHEHSIDHIAEKFAVSAQTARVQLKSVLRKTGTHKQSELVDLMANMPRAR